MIISEIKKNPALGSVFNHVRGLGYVNINPYHYYGQLAGSSLVIYNATIVYVSDNFQVGNPDIAATTLMSYISFFDHNNNDVFYYGQGGIKNNYMDRIAFADIMWHTGWPIDFPVYFSRLGYRNIDYIEFSGYRVTT